jgi:hypothetical protein
MSTNLTVIEPADGEVVLAGDYCPRCGSSCKVCDAFCRRCGNALDEQSPVGQLAVSAERPLVGNLPAWIGRRSVVIGLLLFAGPLGLPALWISPRFSLPTKVITSLLYVGLTVVLPIAMTWYWLNTAMQPLVEAFSTFAPAGQ